jgi:hypothetical protein
MLNRNADRGRTPLTGRVDFMMNIPHDAFTHDLQRLTATTGACRDRWAGRPHRMGDAQKQLHIHHVTEDASLRPTLRHKITRRM